MQVGDKVKVISDTMYEGAYGVIVETHKDNPMNWDVYVRLSGEPVDMGFDFDEYRKRNKVEQKQRDEIINRFSYHSPKQDQQVKYNTITAAFLELALLVGEITPYSGEQSLALTHLQLALTHLQEARILANAAIAVNE